MARLLFIAAFMMVLVGGCANKDDYTNVPLTYLVFFDPDSSDITPDAYAIVQRAAEAVRRVKPQSLVIAGYSDKLGSKAQNLKLSEHRTAIVQKTLIDLGVDVRKITTLPLGAAPDRLGPTADRRIEIRLIKDMSAPTPNE